MEFFVLVIFILTIVLIFVNIKRQRKKNRARMEELGAKSFMICFHIKGLPIVKNATVKLFACRNKLVIEHKKQVFEIPNERIINYRVFDETEIVSIDQSVRDRPISGDVLPRDLRNVVGSKSEISYEVKKKTHHYFIVNYRDKAGDTAVLTFENNFKNLNKLAMEFTNALGRENQLIEDKNGTITL